jgi:glutamyl-tRNA synthetase
VKGTLGKEGRVIGRLAPSPTGLLHLGHARSFLIAWWQARSQQGGVVMRMEDLDAPRARSQFVDDALRDLEWLGLDWDGPVLLQSERLPQLSEALFGLLESGHAYPCICSRGEILAAQSAPQAGVMELRYPGTCRGRFASLEEARERSDRDVGLRFHTPDGPVLVHDLVHGRQDFDVAATVGDFMIGRRDGTPAYQLAVVLDDAHQGVTAVVRGDDLLASTARQILLQRALGLETPVYAHLPLVLDAQGRRLAKRHRASSLAELRERGVDARLIVRWAAETAGISCSDRPTAAECTSSFSLDRLPRCAVTLPDDWAAAFDQY